MRRLVIVLGLVLSLFMSNFSMSSAGTSGCSLTGGLSTSSSVTAIGERICNASQSGTLSVTLYSGGWSFKTRASNYASGSYAVTRAYMYCTPTSSQYSYFVVTSFTSGGATKSATFGPFYRYFRC